tara:strand:+ start:3103 stop:3444 length:342 start_codon:yes stop_codon:yes gene_type:complete
VNVQNVNKKMTNDSINWKNFPLDRNVHKCEICHEGGEDSRYEHRIVGTTSYCTLCGHGTKITRATHGVLADPNWLPGKDFEDYEEEFDDITSYDENSNEFKVATAIHNYSNKK